MQCRLGDNEVCIGHGVFLKMVGVELRVDVLGVEGSRVM